MAEELTQEQVVNNERMQLIANYIGEITAYEKDKEFEKWHQSRAPKVYKRYIDQRDDAVNHTDTKRTNILWSNTEILTAAVFARMPKPDVARRYNNRDPVGRVASMMLERALSFEQEHYKDTKESMKKAILDRYLPGRGCVWVRYEPSFGQMPVQVTEDVYGQFEDENGDKFSVYDMQGNLTQEQDFEIDEDDNYYQTVTETEKTCIDYVNWDDFGHQVSQTWEECGLCWRIVRMTKKEVKARFGETQNGWEISDLPFTDKDQRPTDKNNVQPDPSKTKKTTIYELWDKEKGCTVWLSKHISVPLDKVEDPLHLENFWPLPQPLLATTTTDSLCPTPDFCQYQDQAQELDLLTARRNGLIQALQVKGVYDAEQDNLKRLLTEGQPNELIPVTTWMQFSEKGGIKGTVDFMPLGDVVTALQATSAEMEETTQKIYEISGVADIMRGKSNPQDALGTQKIKSSYASLRTRPEQDEIEEFAAEIMQIRAEIMCNFYSDETLINMALVHTMTEQDQMLVPQALMLLRDNVRRDFSIGVETDSMVQMDQEQEKAARNELLNTVGGYLEKAVLGAEKFPQLGPLLGEMLMFGLRGHNVGRDIESTFEEVVENFKNAPQQQADNGAAVEQAKQQGEMQRITQQSELLDKKHAYDMQMLSAKTDSQIQIETAQAEGDIIKNAGNQPDPINPLDMEKHNVDLVKSAMEIIKSQAEIERADNPVTESTDTPEPEEKIDINQSLNDLMAMFKDQQLTIEKALEVLSRPKKIVRNGSGEVVGAEPVETLQ